MVFTPLITCLPPACNLIVRSVNRLSFELCAQSGDETRDDGDVSVTMFVSSLELWTICREVEGSCYERVWRSQKDKRVMLKKSRKSRRNLRDCTGSRTKSMRPGHGGGFNQLDHEFV